MKPRKTMTVRSGGTIVLEPEVPEPKKTKPPTTSDDVNDKESKDVKQS